MRKKLSLLFAMTLAAAGIGVIADVGMVKGIYWFDWGKPMSFTPGVFEIDTDGLQDGLHTLNAYVEVDGVQSSVSSGMFVKAPSIKDGVDHKAIIFIDGVPFTESQASSAGGILNLDLDCASLPIGVHSVSSQIVTSTGVPTSFKEGFFYRMPTTSELSTMRAYYKIDDTYGGDINVDKGGSVYHLDIDASALSSGIHSVSVFLASPHGLATLPQTAWFIKIPSCGEGVVSYEYWLNDNYDNVKRITLDKVANPLTVLSLMDVDVEPFCSSRYAFAVEDGVPVTYARNDFQARFMDGAQRMIASNGSYTDVRVRNIVTEIDTLAVGESHVAVRPILENEIKWFCFNGEIGDSISLKLNSGAMMELYSPKGESLISRKGSDATAYSTLLLNENGRYYLAIHDVSSRYGGDIRLDFSHIRRFDIVSNTPEVSSTGEDLYINVVGNGFDSLEGISLEKDGKVIRAEKFEKEDNYHLCAKFDLKDEATPLGLYSIIAVFTNPDTRKTETVIRNSAVNLEEVEPVDIEVRVNAPFRPSTPYEVTIEVTNKSKTPCWGVPVNFAVRRSKKGFGISFKDFYPSDAQGMPYFKNSFVATDNLLGTHEAGYYFPTVIPYVGPKETVVLTLGFRSDPMEVIRMYAWAGQPWSEEFKEILSPDFDLNEIAKLRVTNIISARLLCYMYAYNKTLGSLSNSHLKAPRVPQLNPSGLADNNAQVAIAIGQAFGSIGNGMRLRNLDAYGIDLSDDNGQEQTFGSLKDYQNDLKKGMLSPGSIVGTALNDVAGELVDHLLGTAATSADPMPEAHDITCYQSGDPNDMRGYEAPSGSNYIGHKVETIDYTIEFENDPEIANAPAMMVAVENVIDGKTLDLASFRPLTMQIGDKTVELPAEHKFVKTVDMRPEINAIAELDFSYDASEGIAKWLITSLDPMTMEASSYMDDGILPVNDDSGRGTGYLTYSIDLLPGLPDATEVSNSAVIVFDNNSPINTPVWTNITDYTLPKAEIEEVKTEDNLTYTFKVTGEDTGAGIWYYDLFVKEKEAKDWTPVMVQIEADEFTYISEYPLEGATFKVVATDRAGNRQDDVLKNVIIGDADNNGMVDANDVVVIMNYYLEVIDSINRVASDVNSDGVIDSQDALATSNIYLETNIKSQKHIQSRRKR